VNIYVGNLSFDVTESDLRKAFEAFGQITEVRLIMDKFSGKPKGFGFVEMPTAEEAQKAIAEMNGKDLLGRPIKVNEAKPKTDAPRSGGGGRGFGGGGRDRGGSRGGFGGGNRDRGGSRY
jgi:RNA recognition motif-containing protein